MIFVTFLYFPSARSDTFFNAEADMVTEVVVMLQRILHQHMILNPNPKMSELFEWDEERVPRGSFQSHHETTTFFVVGLKYRQDNKTRRKHAEIYLQTHDKLIVCKKKRTALFRATKVLKTTVIQSKGVEVR